MGNTLKIRKSKHLSYQKQGFLYLVFILFLFFSQAGEYVMHYNSMSKTQGALNEYLESRLTGLILEDEASDQYRQGVLARIQSLDSISKEFRAFETQSIAGLDQYRENQFAERIVRRGALGPLFDKLWLEQQAQSRGRWTPTSLADYDGKVSEATDYFFKEAPNAVIPSLVEHAKTSFLLEALEDLNVQALVFEKYTMERLEEAGFTSVYKKRLFLGENFELVINSEALKDSVEFVSINSKEQSLGRKGGTTKLVYRPGDWGKYFVEIQTRSQRFYTSFEVVRPTIQFIAQEELIDLTLGEDQSISINNDFIPEQGYSFESDFAQTSYEAGVLVVNPSTIGEFTLRLLINGQAADSVRLGARSPRLLNVTLADALGREASVTKAHRIQSINPNFQVLSYTATFYPKDGTEAKSFSSLSRLLRPELAQQVQETPGTLVIKNISLISSNGTTKIKAEPLIVASNE